MAAQQASNYVIEMTFESDEGASGLAKANAWLTLQAKGVQLHTVVGDSYSVSVYYSVPPEPTPKVKLPTGGISVQTSPSMFTTTNGSIAA